MRIIIDGNDGVGKTTLAKKLQEHFGIKSYIHSSWNDPSDYMFCRELLRKEDVIFDRCFLDERIYSKVLNRKPRLTLEQEQSLIEFVKSEGILVILCFNDRPIYDSREDKRIVNSKYFIDSKFFELAEQHNFKKFYVKEQNFEQLVNIVSSFFNKNNI